MVPQAPVIAQIFLRFDLAPFVPRAGAIDFGTRFTPVIGGCVSLGLQREAGRGMIDP